MPSSVRAVVRSVSRAAGAAASAVRREIALHRRRGLTLGGRSESIAAEFLRRHGFRVFARNVLTRAGEADILCLAPDGETLVLVEVKSRLAAPGEAAPPLPPEESITQAKRRRLRRIRALLAEANELERRRWRIDAIALEWRAGTGRPEIRHREAFVAV